MAKFVVTRDIGWSSILPSILRLVHDPPALRTITLLTKTKTMQLLLGSVGLLVTLCYLFPLFSAFQTWSQRSISSLTIYRWSGAVLLALGVVLGLWTNAPFYTGFFWSVSLIGLLWMRNGSEIAHLCWVVLQMIAGTTCMILASLDGWIAVALISAGLVAHGIWGVDHLVIPPKRTHD